MTVPPITTKPINELTVTELHDFPIWEYAAETEQSTPSHLPAVRPVMKPAVPTDATTFIVSARLMTAGGNAFPGFMLVTPHVGPDGAPGIRPGGVFVDGRYVPIIGAPSDDTPAWMKAAMEDMQRTFEQAVGGDAFPLTYELQVRIDDDEAPRRGTID